MIFTLLFIFWIVLNENITGEIIIFGLFLSTIVTYFSYKTLRISKGFEKKVFVRLGRIINYLLILIWEIILANIDVIRLVLTKDPELSPTLMNVRIKGIGSRASKVALANSITLTPGTITVSLNGDDYLIHAIVKSNLDGMEESIFVEKLKKLEE